MNDYFDLGNYSRTVSDNKNSQTWFDRGMVWLFAYNHEEAIACFEKAIEADQKVHLLIGVSHTLSVPTTINIGRFLRQMKKVPYSKRPINL